MFLGYKRKKDRWRWSHQSMRTLSGLASVKREWAERVPGSPHFNPASSVKYLIKRSQEPTELMPTTPALSQGVCWPRDTDKDFIIARLIHHLEALHLAQKASSHRSLTHEMSFCCSLPESTKHLKHQNNNQLRTMNHRWMLGLQHPVSRNRNDHTSSQSQGKSQRAIKTESVLKITPIQARQTKTKGSVHLSSTTFDNGILDVKVSNTHPPNKTLVSFDSHSDSDLSDLEKECIETSKLAAAVEIDLKPETFDKDVDVSCCTELQLYPEVLPAPYNALDFTQTMSLPQASEALQNLSVADPCLAPIIERLMEMERLQSATVQKERARPVRSCVNTRNANRLKKSDLAGSKTGTAGKAACNFVACSFTKLVQCPDSSCRCWHNNYPMTNISSGMNANPILPKLQHTLSGKFKRATNSSNISPKTAMPDRVQRSKPLTYGSTTAKRTAAAPDRKT